MKLLLLIFVLPWAVPQISTFISIHWMLNGEWGFLNNVLYTLFHIEGPSWLNDRWSALGAVIVSHIWKWTPFWTLILLAGRMAIPLEISDSAKVDGATGMRGFVHITFPLLANLYLICTLLSTIFLLGDFNAVNFVSGGGPANQGHVLATLGIRNAFEIAQPRLGVAAVMSALPMVTFFALLFGTLTSFAIGRMRIRHGWLVTNAALLTYVIPASFLAIPFYRIMQNYGLANNPWSVIAALVAFATPYAIFVFQEYGRSIPIEVDESARIDGASPPQIYLRIYLPLMAPALVAVGTYALLLAWNEYLYQFLLLSSKANMTVPVALAQFLSSDQSPWNYMMATAIIYAAPPVAIYYAFRRRMTSGLTMGGVKG